MIEEVLWNKVAVAQAKNITLYLETNYSEKVAFDFVDNLENLITKLKSYPEIRRKSMKIDDVRQFRIDNFNRLYYKINGKSIIVLLIYGDKQNPESNPYL